MVFRLPDGWWLVFSCRWKVVRSLQDVQSHGRPRVDGRLLNVPGSTGGSLSRGAVGFVIELVRGHVETQLPARCGGNQCSSGDPLAERSGECTKKGSPIAQDGP